MTLKQKIEEAIKKLLEYFDMHLHTVNGKDVCDYCQCLICESRKPVKDAYEILRSIQPPEAGEFRKELNEFYQNYGLPEHIWERYPYIREIVKFAEKVSTVCDHYAAIQKIDQEQEEKFVREIEELKARIKELEKRPEANEFTVEQVKDEYRRYRDMMDEKIKKYEKIIDHQAAHIRELENPSDPSEFTKQWRERLDNAVALFKMGKNPDEWFQSIVTGFRESLTINACQDAYIEELKTENSKLKTQN